MTDIRVLSEVWDVICDRADHPSPGSYVSRLLTDEKGIDRVLEKVGEESTEFVIAVKNGVRERTIQEAADLQFHFLVTLRAAGLDFDDVLEELAARRR